MFQATAIFQGAEIGYGEGEGAAYALQECIDSIDSFYLGLDPDSVQIIVNGGNRRLTLTMDHAVNLCY